MGLRESPRRGTAVFLPRHGLTGRNNALRASIFDPSYPDDAKHVFIIQIEIKTILRGRHFSRQQDKKRGGRDPEKRHNSRGHDRQFKPRKMGIF